MEVTLYQSQEKNVLFQKKSSFLQDFHDRKSEPYFEKSSLNHLNCGSVNIMEKYCQNKKLNSRRHILREGLICLAKFILKSTTQSLHCFLDKTCAFTQLKYLLDEMEKCSTEKHWFWFFRIAVCQVGGQPRMLNRSHRSGKIGVRERQRSKVGTESLSLRNAI